MTTLTVFVARETVEKAFAFNAKVEMRAVKVKKRVMVF